MLAIKLRKDYEDKTLEEIIQERNKILGVGHPIRAFFRRFERLILVLADNDWKYVVKKVKKNMKIKSGKLVEK